MLKWHAGSLAGALERYAAEVTVRPYGPFLAAPDSSGWGVYFEPGPDPVAGCIMAAAILAQRDSPADDWADIVETVRMDRLGDGFIIY